jgi:hypothetical protein
MTRVIRETVEHVTDSRPTRVRDFRFPDTATIHQPHFLPWLPYIARLASSSQFALLDDVQFRRYYFQNRTILEPENAAWLTVAVKASTSSQVGNVPLAAPRFIGKLATRIHHRYHDAPYFKRYWPRIQSVFDDRIVTLLDLNVKLLSAIFDVLDVAQPQIWYSSTIQSSTGNNCGDVLRTMRVIDICRHIGVSKLLGGWGRGESVHDLELIESSGVRMIVLPKTRLYERYWGELRGVSILQPLFCCGAGHVRDEIQAFHAAYYESGILERPAFRA